MKFVSDGEQVHNSHMRNCSAFVKHEKGWFLTMPDSTKGKPIAMSY